MDICSKCGDEYDDVLGIGSCAKCLFGGIPETVSDAAAERNRTKELCENIIHHIHTWSDEPERAMRLVLKEIDSYYPKHKL